MWCGRLDGRQVCRLPLCFRYSGFPRLSRAYRTRAGRSKWVQWRHRPPPRSCHASAHHLPPILSRAPPSYACSWPLMRACRGWVRGRAAGVGEGGGGAAGQRQRAVPGCRRGLAAPSSLHSLLARGTHARLPVRARSATLSSLRPSFRLALPVSAAASHLARLHTHRLTPRVLASSVLCASLEENLARQRDAAPMCVGGALTGPGCAARP